MAATVLRNGRLVIASVSLALGSFAGLGEPVALADTSDYPHQVSPLALNQVGSGRLNPPNGNYSAFDIPLPAGDYEVRAWGQNPTGGYLDTVVSLYGPRGGHAYPRRPIAINDDENPTLGSAAALRATVLGGTYRIIVTSYRQAYSGTFSVVACPPGACAKAQADLPQAPDGPRAPG
jgi:hypothetical protein